MKLTSSATAIQDGVQSVDVILPLPLPSTILSILPPSTVVNFHLPDAVVTPDPLVSALHLQLAQYSYTPRLPTSSSALVTYTSPSAHVAVSTSSTAPTRPLALPRRSTAKAKKAALWALDSPQLPDGGKSLLQPADLVRPECVYPDASDKPAKRRRACKDCTCGLKELEVEEQEQASARQFFLEGDDDIPEALKVATEGTESIWPVDKRAEAKKTGSCGNCSLGDAFRCNSCPYMGKCLAYIQQRADVIGLPAFKPGEKVQISLGLDDI